MVLNSLLQIALTNQTIVLRLQSRTFLRKEVTNSDLTVSSHVCNTIHQYIHNVEYTSTYIHDVHDVQYTSVVEDVYM